MKRAPPIVGWTTPCPTTRGRTWIKAKRLWLSPLLCPSTVWVAWSEARSRVSSQIGENLGVFFLMPFVFGLFDFGRFNLLGVFRVELTAIVSTPGSAAKEAYLWTTSSPSSLRFSSASANWPTLTLWSLSPASSSASITVLTPVWLQCTCRKLRLWTSEAPLEPSTSSSSPSPSWWVGVS